MSAPFNWFARLVNTLEAPVAGLKVELQIFDRQTGAWAAVSSGVSSATGLLRGKGSLDQDSALLAPAMRLIEAGQLAVLSAAPRLSQDGEPAMLYVDFGELLLLDPAVRFVQPRAALARVADDPFTVGALVGRLTPAMQLLDTSASLIALRAQISDELQHNFAATLAEKDSALADKERQLGAREQELAAARTTIDGLRTRAGVTPAAVGLREIAAPVGVAEFASQVGVAIGGAQAALKSTGFSLGRVALTARALVGNNATLSFLDKDELKGIPAGSLSDLELQFGPDRQAVGGGGLLVPDVRQLTESAARRIIASVGLVMETSHGSSELQPDAAEGQAMLQSPAPGTAVASGARVLVVFARSSRS